MTVRVSYSALCTVEETLDVNTGSAADASRKVTHGEYNETTTLSATTTPPATICAHFLLTLTAGTGTINLTALVGTNGATVNGTGLKLQIFRFKNLGAAPMTIAPAGANPYSPWGAAKSIIIQAGAHQMNYFNDATEDVSATIRDLTVTGTGTQTAECTMVLG